MKPGFIFVLLAFGTLICATYAAPASSEIQQDDDDTAASKKELLKLLDQIAAKSQQNGDSDLNNKLAEAEFFKKLYI